MSQLSKQSIRRLCTPPLPWHNVYPEEGKQWHPLITPFEPGKVRVAGVSKGLSAASYDASIAHDLVLGRHPGFVIREWVLGLRFSKWPTLREIPGAIRYFTGALSRLQRALMEEPPHYALAHTVEDFCLPANVSGAVCDKSTFARVFVSAYNTFFDPGFHGNATLELVNDSDRRVEYKAGQGVCQFVFEWLDEPTEEPYNGKYQGQTKAAHAARYEEDDEARAPWHKPEGIADHWTVKYWPWKGGYEYEVMRKDFYRAGAWVKCFEDIEPDAISMTRRIDERQPIKQV